MGIERLVYVFVIFILGSCSSSKSIPDYSASALKPLQTIKTYLESSDIDSFDVKIVNMHGGRFEVSSEIVKTPSGVKLNTHTKNFSGDESDTIMFFQGQEFLQMIDFEIAVVDNQIAVAGNYQSIQITCKNESEVFYTRRGLGLLSLIARCESNMRK